MPCGSSTLYSGSMFKLFLHTRVSSHPSPGRPETVRVNRRHYFDTLSFLSPVLLFGLPFLLPPVFPLFPFSLYYLSYFSSPPKFLLSFSLSLSFPLYSIIFLSFLCFFLSLFCFLSFSPTFLSFVCLSLFLLFPFFVDRTTEYGH